MSKFTFDLSYKEVMILKHSLEQRIERDKAEYDKLRKIIKNMDDKLITDEVRDFIKEHEEHLKCLESFVEGMKCTGYRHGSNIFGDKYRD